MVTNCLNPSPSSNRQKHFLENEVSVVISTYSKNRLNDLLDAIDSINQQSLKPIEIILVVDPSPRVLDFYDLHTPPNVKIVVSEKPGLSNARNMGSKEATGKIIAYMDDDAVADKDWLRNIVEEFRNPDVVGVGGVIHPIWEDGRPFWFPEEMNWIVGCSYKGLPEKKTFVRNPIGCNMAFRKEILEKVGGFRPDIGRFRNTLLAGEEPELSMRILDNISNSKILHTPSAVVYHKVKKKRLGLKHLFLRSFYEGISKALIYVSVKNTKKKLSTETSYLEFMIKETIPSKLRGINRIENASQLLTLFILTLTVFGGFIAFSLFKLVAGNE